MRGEGPALCRPSYRERERGGGLTSEPISFVLPRQPSIAATAVTQSQAAAGDGWPMCACSFAVILGFFSFSHAAHVASHLLSVICSLLPPLLSVRYFALMGLSWELSEV